MRLPGVQFKEQFMDLKSRGASVVPEPLMKAILLRFGIPVPKGRLCEAADEAVTFARKAKYPLVLKLVSDRVLHKTELNGVVLGIGSEGELKKAFTGMQARFSGMKIPGYMGILVEEQSPAGQEIIVGLQNDAVFGPLLMAGMGGVITDLFEDVAFRMLPVSKPVIRAMLRGLKSRPLLEGFRGTAGGDVKTLIDIIHRISIFAREMAPYYESVDFNPVIVTPDGVMAVDAKMVLSKKPAGNVFSFESPRTGNLDLFFNPASVAVMGASNVPGKIGNVILDSLVKYEFRGTIYPINPNYEELLGIKCYKSLDELPGIPELVVVVVDLKMMPGIISDMARLGCRNALIVSGGGKELGGERAALEADIARRARENGVRIIGPNCIGSFDGKSRFDSFFHSHERLLRPPAGSMSFITQSGTWGCVFLESAEKAGVAKMVSYGNRADVDEGDLVAYLAGDPDTKVIGSYIEGLGKGRKFVAAVQGALDAGKPVAVFKTGRNRQSAGASVSHTGAYGGSYHIYKGVLEQAGVILTDSFHELYASCEALSLQPPARGKGAAMLSNGAGPMVNALDLFPQKGLELVRLSRPSVSRMKDHFSFFYLVENPVDITGSATAEDYEFVIRTLMDDDGVDIIMPFFVFQDTPLDESIIERLEALGRGRRKPIVGCATGGPYTGKMSAALLSAGIPVYPDVARWVAAASALVQWGRIKK